MRKINEEIDTTRLRQADKSEEKNAIKWKLY